MIKISNKEHWLLEQTELSKVNIAIRSNEIELSYDELLKLAKKTVNYFSEKGIAKNNHVAIVSENNLEFVIVVNALWFLGAIPVPLNPKLNKNELTELIEISDSDFTIIIQLVYDQENEVIDYRIENLKNYVSDTDIVKYESSNICLMMFTSGSSGSPKCVQLTFDNLFHSAKSADLEVKHLISDLWLVSLPFYHIGGFSIITRTIISGCSLVLPISLKNNDLISSINKFKPTLLSLVPLMFMNMVTSISKPWVELKIIFIGGGPMNSEIFETVKESLWPVYIVYGSTETSSMVTFCSNSNLLENGISAGKPFLGVEIAIEGSENNLNEKKTAGKIIIKSRSVAVGYYKSNIEECKKFESGVYFSNDLGYFDRKDNLQIIGRSDDIIISGGENISLNEISKLISDKNSYGDCLAIGVNDEKWGQSYLIITDSKENEIEDKIEKLLTKKVAKFKMPKSILKIEKIPRNELGKLQKKELQKLVSFDFL